MPQVDQLVRCARTAVFFIDDRQNVRSQEIGSSELIRRSAREYGCEISEVTQQTAAGTKQAAVSISNLATLAGELRASVSIFKLPAHTNEYQEVA